MSAWWRAARGFHLLASLVCQVGLENGKLEFGQLALDAYGTAEILLMVLWSLRHSFSLMMSEMEVLVVW